MAAPADKLGDGVFVADFLHKTRNHLVRVGEADERSSRMPGSQDGIAVVVALKENNATMRPASGGMWRTKAIGNGWQLLVVSAAALTAVDPATVAYLARRKDTMSKLLSAWAKCRLSSCFDLIDEYPPVRRAIH
eukprot:m51a1_g6582 hypothetical protein (134) ;mRNA; r:222200-222836